MSAPGLILRKTIQLVRWDLAFLRGRYPPAGARVRYLLGKYLAIATGARSVRWLGATFRYDNRWTPAILQPYPLELRRLDQAVDLAAARTVLDVGANVGQFAATAVAMFPQLQVWSLEPSPAAFALLERNSARHAGWRALPFGAGDRDERRAFWVVPGKSAQGSVHRENASQGLVAGDARQVSVDLRRITAAVCAEHGMPTAFDVIKVDVEGAEREALRGLRELQWRSLVVETTTGRAGGVSAEQAVALVRELWGECRLVHEETNHGVGEVIFRRLDPGP